MILVLFFERIWADLINFLPIRPFGQLVIQCVGPGCLPGCMHYPWENTCTLFEWMVSSTYSITFPVSGINGCSSVHWLIGFLAICIIRMTARKARLHYVFCMKCVFVCVRCNALKEKSGAEMAPQWSHFHVQTWLLRKKWLHFNKVEPFFQTAPQWRHFDSTFFSVCVYLWVLYSNCRPGIVLTEHSQSWNWPFWPDFGEFWPFLGGPSPSYIDPLS